MAAHLYDPFPKYLQIRGIILHWLATLKIGDRLPTEELLAEKFNVSRETIREALRPLGEDGTLGRRPRLGTWLVKHPTEALDRRLTGPFENFATLPGVKIELSSATQGEIEAKPDVATALKLRKGERAYRFQRVRSYEGQPIVVIDALFPPKIGRKLASFNLSELFFLPALRKAVAGYIYEQYQQIEAASPSAANARLLKLPNTAPILLVKRVFVDGDGKPVGMFKSYFRSDSYYYTVNLPKIRNGAGAKTGKTSRNQKKKPSRKRLGRKR